MQRAGGLDRERLLVAFQPAGRQVRVAGLNGALHFVDADVARGERVGIHLHAHGVLLRAEDLHARHAADHRDALRQQRLGVLVDRVQRQRGRWSARYSTGCSAGFTFWNDGGRGMGGRRPPAFEIAACTSCAAASMSRSRANWIVICVLPCELVEVIDSMPAIVENSRSSGVATADAIVSGFAPGKRGLHLNRRIVDCGKRGNRQGPERDDAEQAEWRSDTSAVMTGRSMKMRERFMTYLLRAFVGSTCRMRAPGNNRRWPSMTTVSPGAIPLCTMVFEPILRPVSTTRGSTVWSGLTKYTNDPFCPD